MPESAPATPPDPDAWVERLGVSREAAALHAECDVIDLHVDSFIWTRVFGYDLSRRHGSGLFLGRYYSQADFPRAIEGGLGGAVWAITTSPTGSSGARRRRFERDLAGLRRRIEGAEGVTLVRTAAEYAAARAAGLHGAFLGIQGGNALDAPGALSALSDDAVVRVTLVHLSNSSLGESSSPLRLHRGGGLTAAGRAYVEGLDARRVFVDLAHIGPAAFDDAVAAHDPDLPLMASHTGVSGVCPSWRNLDDGQLRRIADTGGLIGVVFHSFYLGDPYYWGGRAARIADHIAHIVDTVGEDHAAIGSDFDGMIVPPRDLATCDQMPRLTQCLLDRGYDDGRIRKILGGNFLRALRQLRG